MDTQSNPKAVELVVELVENAFVRQVEDRALPAREILLVQRAELGPDAPIGLFIP